METDHSEHVGDGNWCIDCDVDIRIEQTKEPVHAVFYLKQCGICYAMHKSAEHTRFCPACGSRWLTIVTVPPTAESRDSA